MTLSFFGIMIIQIQKERVKVMDWKDISTEALTEEFLEEHKNRVNWKMVSKKTVLTENMIKKFHNYVNYDSIAIYQRLSYLFILEHWGRLKLLFLKRNPNVHLQEQEWDVLHRKEEERFKQYLTSVGPNWKHISSTIYLSEQTIETYQDFIHWDNVSQYQILSEEFIKKFRHRVIWTNISFRQKLSEDFIEDMKNYVSWDMICMSQELSEAFIVRNQEKIAWDYLMRNPFLSKEQKEKYKEKHIPFFLL